MPDRSEGSRFSSISPAPSTPTFSRSARIAGAVAAIVLVVAVGCDDRDGRVVLVGSIERTLIELSAPATETIVDILVERGQTVEEGDTVARLDATVARAELARTAATVAAARTAEAVALHDLDRVRDLRRKGIAAPQDLERAQLAWEEASARREEAQALRDVATKRLTDLEILSPVAGVVDQIPFDAGERVPLGAVLVVLERDDPPWVRTWIPERAVAQLPRHTAAEILLDGDRRRLVGCLEHVAREPEFTPHYALTERERAHLVYEARIRLGPEAHALRSGTPVTVVFALDDGSDAARTSRCQP